MPRCLTRISLALMLLLTSEVWALGLGEVNMESALNEPLRAEIELLSASAEELEGLKVALASPETFDRYGLDRPAFLQEIAFDIVRSGRADGNYIRVRSAGPITEPFVTFLLEATWSRGRLLREYTVLLDPPTFAPPPPTPSQPAVTAPQRSAPVDSGRIERTPDPVTRSEPAPSRPLPQPAQPVQRSETATAPVADDTPYDRESGSEYTVNRGDTLWGIASSMRPDSRLSINQTMLAIYESNPEAFGGNINLLREGARLRLPSADSIYRIDLGDAISEVQRQNTAWGISDGVSEPDDTRTSLTLVPPDEDPVGIDTGTDIGVDTDIGTEPATREEQVLDQIAAIEAEAVPYDDALIEIRNNELAALRRELAEIRGEVYEPPVDDIADGVDDPFVDDVDDQLADDAAADVGEPLDDGTLFPDLDDIQADDTVEDTTPADDAVEETADTTPAVTRRQPKPSLLDQALEWLKSWGLIIGGAVVVVIGLLIWFMRRGGADDEPDAWGAAPLDDDELEGGLTGTESMRAPTRDDESIVVVEQETGIHPTIEPTVEVMPPTDDQADVDTGTFGSLEDTFSSDTAVNLDQSDPIAEADFHMAYGLYDQAADLVNGALSVEPKRQDLLTKLCEIYFVWGNRDSFIDAAERLNDVVGGAGSADWDKIVIMGQQIAGDHSLFAGAGVAGATRAVDLALDSDGGDAGALDMDFGDDAGEGDVIDLGSGEDDIIDLGVAEASDDEGVDFLFEEAADEGSETIEQTVDADVDFSVTSEMPTMEQTATEATVEMPSEETTVETPTVEEPFTGLEATTELPSIDPNAIEPSGLGADETAEINLDDLGLDLDGLGDDDVTELASLDDLDETGSSEALEDDASVATGKNPQVDPYATGVQPAIDMELENELTDTGVMRLAADETGQNPLMDPAEDATDTSIDESLLEATGRTQVLPEDFAVETIGDDDATMLASIDGDDDSDFDFAKTEALPKDSFEDDLSVDETGEVPEIASTDVDLDLDDLTAALQVSDIGDTVEQLGEDATIEQPRPGLDAGETGDTLALNPDDIDGDLHEARTMTEVGTKLDLARAYVDMGDPSGARSILEEVLDEGDEGQRQQAQQLLDSLPS